MSDDLRQQPLHDSVLSVEVGEEEMLKLGERTCFDGGSEGGVEGGLVKVDGTLPAVMHAPNKVFDLVAMTGKERLELIQTLLVDILRLYPDEKADLGRVELREPMRFDEIILKLGRQMRHAEANLLVSAVVAGRAYLFGVKVFGVVAGNMLRQAKSVEPQLDRAPCDVLERANGVGAELARVRMERNHRARSSAPTATRHFRWARAQQRSATPSSVAPRRTVSSAPLSTGPPLTCFARLPRQVSVQGTSPSPEAAALTGVAPASRRAVQPLRLSGSGRGSLRRPRELVSGSHTSSQVRDALARRARLNRLQ